MSSIVKENDVLTAVPEAASHASSAAVLPGEATNKPQPVALEVAVSVNGARTVEGSDKREPFSEATKTVLVFGNGAVIRLSSSVATGQLLFLTNEKTKKEVVCQVVKSKNYRSVSGYVELEFTEPVAGFWGMRFPDDRLGSQSANGPVAVTSPAAPKTAAPAPTQASAPVAPKPAAPLNLVPAKVESPAAPVLHMRRASDQRPLAVVAQPPVPAAPAVPQVPPASAVQLPPAPVAAAPPAAKTQSNPAKENSSDALKLEAARLQEQLSSLLFAEIPKPAKPATPIPAMHQKKVAETAAKIFEVAKTEPAPEVAKPLAPVVSAPPAVKSVLDTGEVKIPSWLEPLARNVSAPSSTEELIEREKAKRAAATPKIEEPAIDPVPPAELNTPEEVAVEVTPEVAPPTFGAHLAIDEKDGETENSSSGSKKGILIAVIAAVLVLAAGGFWYFREQILGPQAATGASASLPARVIPSGGAAVTASQPPAAAGVVGPVNAAANSGSSAVAPAANPPVPASVREARENSVVSNPASSARNPQPAPQPKRPALGEVHLAAPTVRHGASTEQNAEADPAISMNGGQIASTSDSLGGGIATVGTKQPVAPAAPLPVGGDVKQAKLISQVSPSYPALAKSQHVSGNVTVDALIDATGRVTTMKILSGPTLLQQPAMDALRQWKYEPATLDGKPVAMHLTVTLQFRLQ